MLMSSWPYMATGAWGNAEGSIYVVDRVASQLLCWADVLCMFSSTFEPCCLLFNTLFCVLSVDGFFFDR